MTGGSGALAPRLAGVTARVETTPRAARVTLRPRRASRRRAAAFLAAWLTGWVIGEIHALGFLAMLLGVKLGPFSGMKLPAGGGAPAAETFLLLWLPLWTCGGFATLFTLARTAWGVDVLTMSADRWTVRWSVGRWGRRWRFNPKNARRVGLRGRSGALVVEINGRTVVLTHFGTDADRLWLRDLLQDAASGLRNDASTVAASGSDQLNPFRV
jgi:hypothetical protein